MTAEQKFNPMRKGLLEFLILQIISADKVYVAVSFEGVLGGK